MVKQVIVMRKDLNMRKGKMISQGAHASMKVFFDRLIYNENLPKGGYWRALNFSPKEKEWIEDKFTKICVSVNSEQELLDVYNAATANGIRSALIQDAGLTEFGGVPTYTCCAIGPDDIEKIDAITGKLPLL